MPPTRRLLVYFSFFIPYNKTTWLCLLETSGFLFLPMTFTFYVGVLLFDQKNSLNSFLHPFYPIENPEVKRDVTVSLILVYVNKICSDWLP